MKLVDIVQLAAAFHAAGIRTNYSWLSRHGKYRLVSKQWFFKKFGPAMQQHLRSLGREHNPGKPGWQCAMQTFECTSFAKIENARVGGLAHNIAIGRYDFDQPDQPDGHSIMVAATFPKAVPVFWDLTYARPYELSKDDGLNGSLLQI